MTSGKIKSNNYNIFCFNDTVLWQNILAYCRMRRRREWGAMAVVYLFSPRYIVCHVSAVQKILSMHRQVFFCRLP